MYVYIYIYVYVYTYTYIYIMYLMYICMAAADPAGLRRTTRAGPSARKRDRRCQREPIYYYYYHYVIV